MKSTIEPVEGNKVKLSITVDADEFESAIDAAWREIAKEVRIPGFRNGKVPRKVLEARIDSGVARSEALNEALPEYYVAAIREHDVDVIAQPEIDITDGEESGDVSFDAIVEVRPIITVDGYADLTITVPSPEPTDDDIADQIDRLRGNYADTVVVERPAAAGDYVTIDIAGTDADGEPIDGLTADDYLYEVGAGNIGPELDENLRGVKAGETVTFDAAHPDPSEETTVSFEVTVKEVKERVLPELDDEWVAEATEFKTVDELRDDVIDRQTKVKRTQASMGVQSGIGDALAELVTIELPESMVGSELRARLEDLIHRLSHQGLTLETYMQITGTEPAKFTEDLRSAAVQSIKVDLALRAIGVAEGLAATDEDLDEEIEKLAVQTGLEPDEVRAQLESNDQMSAIRSDLSNRNALRWLTDTVNIVDETGKAVDRGLLDLDDEDDLDDDEHDDHDHDHDHDHEGHDHDHGDHDHDH